MLLVSNKLSSTRKFISCTATRAERNSAGPPPSRRNAGSCLASSAEICCRTWNHVFTVFKFVNFVPFFHPFCTFISLPRPLKQYITLTVAIDRRSMSLLSSNLAKFVSSLYPLCTLISFPPHLKQFIKSNMYFQMTVLKIQLQSVQLA